MEKLIKQLQELLTEENVKLEEPMAKHTTFRVGGPADILVTPTVEKLPEVLQICRTQEVDVTIIGNGSNLLVGDKGIRSVVVEIGKSASHVQIRGTEITVEAGTLLAKMAMEAYQNELTGMEFAAGIPGTVGGAVVMNAGAYGGEMKDIITSVKVLTPQGEIADIPVEEMDFGYRHSCILEKGYIVLSAQLKLKKGKAEEIKARMDELKTQRMEKQPLNYPSAGSTFKRPEGYFAGKLIMDAGLRGYSVGDAQISEKHCGFVVNRGKATAEDVLELICDVQSKVKKIYNVDLETEVKMIGEF